MLVEVSYSLVESEQEYQYIYAQVNADQLRRFELSRYAQCEHLSCNKQRNSMLYTYISPYITDLSAFTCQHRITHLLWTPPQNADVDMVTAPTSRLGRKRLYSRTLGMVFIKLPLYSSYPLPHHCVSTARGLPTSPISASCLFLL